MGVLQKCMEHKLVYLETKDVVETTLALDNYKKACDSGRGAVFLSIARGKVAEGIDFDNHYGRCVVLFGIPYQYTKSHVLRARLDFMREKYQVFLIYFFFLFMPLLTKENFVNFSFLSSTNLIIFLIEFFRILLTINLAFFLSFIVSLLQRIFFVEHFILNRKSIFLKLFPLFYLNFFFLLCYNIY